MFTREYEEGFPHWNCYVLGACNGHSKTINILGFSRHAPRMCVCVCVCVCVWFVFASVNVRNGGEEKMSTNQICLYCFLIFFFSEVFLRYSYRASIMH